MEQQTVRPFGIRDKLGYLFGDFGNDFTFILSTMILMKFYTDVMGVGAGIVGTVMMIARFADAFTDVTMGRICDRHKGNAQGKFKPWILRMCGPVAVSSFLIYQSALSDAPQWLKIGYLCVTYILWGSVFYTSINIPYGSMASAISEDPGDRQSLSTFRTMGGMLAGAVIGVGLPLIAYQKNAETGKEVLVGSRVTLAAGIFSVLAMADFTFYGGLYRDVNLIAVSDAHFDLEYYGGSGIAVTPMVQGDSAQVRVQVFLNSVKKGQSLFYCLQDRDGKHVSEAVCTADCTEVTMEIPKVHLWHGRKSPYLYTACAELRENGEVLDRVSARFGCRSFRIDAEKGFILNGEPYPLRGVSRHQDRWGLGNALLPEHHEEDMDLICELGATTVRLAHYQHDRYFYDLCDERGLVVWAEIPYISKHMPKASENAEAQLRELIVQNYNHPSIVVWGLSNEITMNGSDADLLETHKHLNALAHELDSTRPTTVAVVSMCDMHDPYLKIPDVISYNHYFGWYGGDTAMNGPWLDRFHETFPDLPIGVSEYGCEGLDWHTSDPVQGDYTEEYQAYYHEELIKQLFTRPYLWATHVWNMFDFGADARNEGGENGQNHKGLVTFDRKYKKDAFYAYKAWLSDEPFVHICGKRYTERTEEVTKVTVYSNLPTVELFRNGESIDRQTSREA